MKYFVLINFLFLFFTGCTNKLPIPGSDNIESILIIPHKAINQTKKPFGFKYTFTLKTEDGRKNSLNFIQERINNILCLILCLLVLTNLKVETIV